MTMDERYMMRAIGLAKRAKGMTNPNPVVGCVIVKNSKIAGEGYHEKAGFAHAEVIALRIAGKKAKDATMYVTLEPCTHYGKTPPCTAAILKSGVKRVVVAMKDPNPLNNGRGIEVLKKNGISVIPNICADLARKINKSYSKFIKSGMPFVTLKMAESLDGKIATSKGESKWISNKHSRKYVHLLRSKADAIMVGINTVLKDNPLLLPKRSSSRQIRVVVDTNLKISLSSQIIRTCALSPIVIVTTRISSKRKQLLLRRKGVNVMVVDIQNGKVNLKNLLKELGKIGVMDLLVEGGAELAGSLCDQRLVDRVLTFIAPKVIGGRNAVTAVKGKGIDRLSKALTLQDVEVKRFRDDVMICGDVS